MQKTTIAVFIVEMMAYLNVVFELIFVMIFAAGAQ
jgi:hypothetical protein